MHHPDLAARARFLPQGSPLPAALPLLRAVGQLAGLIGGRRAQYVPLAGGSLYLFRPREPRPGPTPAMLWMHGGGLVLGDARQDFRVIQRLVRELRIPVASVQYRLAPEHPFPAGLDDCAEAFRWLAGQPDIDAERIVVGGASAGGGLSAALCQRLRDEGGPQPSFQTLIYPMLDDRTPKGGPPDQALRLWTRRSNDFGWKSYLRGHDRAGPPPHAVPARAGELSGLPPAWIGVGTADLFHAEDVAYSQRLQAAGVPTQLEVVEGAYHGFDQAHADAPCAEAFTRSYLDALSRHLQQS